MTMAMLHTNSTLRPTKIPLGNPWEAWRLGWAASELWMNSAFNIMSRANWLANLDPNQGQVQREWQRRWGEEMATGLEVAMEVQRAGYDMWLGRFNPWRTSRRVLRPLHRRSAAHAKRPARADCS